ncbi:MAG: hypothetical protein V4490_06175, partial [Pseudomonadota bacterium]
VPQLMLTFGGLNVMVNNQLATRSVEVDSSTIFRFWRDEMNGGVEKMTVANLFQGKMDALMYSSLDDVRALAPSVMSELLKQVSVPDLTIGQAANDRLQLVYGLSAEKLTVLAKSAPHILENLLQNSVPYRKISEPSYFMMIADSVPVLGIVTMYKLFHSGYVFEYDESARSELLNQSMENKLKAFAQIVLQSDSCDFFLMYRSLIRRYTGNERLHSAVRTIFSKVDLIFHMDLAVIQVAPDSALAKDCIANLIQTKPDNNKEKFLAKISPNSALSKSLNECLEELKARIDHPRSTNGMRTAAGNHYDTLRNHFVTNTQDFVRATSRVAGATAKNVGNFLRIAAGVLPSAEEKQKIDTEYAEKARKNAMYTLMWANSSGDTSGAKQNPSDDGYQSGALSRTKLG